MGSGDKTLTMNLKVSLWSSVDINQFTATCMTVFLFKSNQHLLGFCVQSFKCLLQVNDYMYLCGYAF